MSATLQTDRTTVRRLPQRGAYDRDTVYAILDEALICHVGFVVEGSPVVIPTIHWREGDTLYFHGSAAAGFLRSLRTGADACVTVTLLDGLVLARSAFHHSMNYRSAVILGKAREVTGAEKHAALTSLVVQPPIFRGVAETRSAGLSDASPSRARLSAWIAYESESSARATSRR